MKKIITFIIILCVTFCVADAILLFNFINILSNM